MPPRDTPNLKGFKTMEPKSKSEKKRDMIALQKLGERLVTLAPAQAERIEMPLDLRNAITFARSIASHAARRRQMQTIGAIMRRIDPEPIRQALAEIEAGDLRKALAFKQAEQWREALVAGDDVLLAKLFDTIAGDDRQHLGQLVRNARKIKDGTFSPKAGRLLLAYLRKRFETGDNTPAPKEPATDSEA